MLIVDPELSALIPPLQADEFERLEASIRAEGCRDALVVWASPEDDILLDGHNRLRICRKHRIRFRIRKIRLASREHARLWVEEWQLSRRNVSDDQRAALAVDILERRSTLVRVEQLRRARAAKAGAPVSEPSSDTEKRDSRTEVSKESRVSEWRLRCAREVKKADPALHQKIRDGQLSLADARREIGRAKLIEKVDSIRARRAKELAGTFDLISIDPPWPFQTFLRGATPGQSAWPYPTLSIDEIRDKIGTLLNRHAAPDAHIFLWVTMRHLPVAFELLRAWGLRYVLEVVWHKTGGAFGVPGLPRFFHESVLYARRGHARFITTKGFTTCFSAPSGAHSEKPQFFYDMVGRACGGRKLDLFSRRARPGWTGWGLEAEDDSDAESESNIRRAMAR